MSAADTRRVLSLDENLARLPSAVLQGAAAAGSIVLKEAVAGQSFCFVGSGASFSVAHFGARLFEAMLGAPSRVKSPFDFRNSPTLDEGAVLISASGGNRDILAALDRSVTAGHKPILAVTCNPSAELILRGRELPNFGSLLIPFELRGEREGFLGIQSLAASAAGLLSFCWSFLNSGSPPDFRALTEHVIEQTGRWQKQLHDAAQYPHVVALGSGWSIPGVIDLESKFVEGGLGWLEVAETKNFTHGRFVNSYRRQEETVILLLGTADDEVLRRDFQQEFGKSLRVIDISVSSAGPLAGFTSLLAAQFVYAGFAKARGLASGKPPVPPEARRMFRGDHIYPELELRSRAREYGEAVAALKHAAVDAATPTSHAAVIASSVARLAITTFHGLACDYDGTIVTLDPKKDVPSEDVAKELRRFLGASVPIAIVTGRGRSVVAHLREVIPAHLRRNVHCFLYNGGVYWRLDSEKPDTVVALTDAKEIGAHLERARRGSWSDTSIEVASLDSQVTVHVPDGADAHAVRADICAALTDWKDQIVVLTSGRSVDVFPVGVSKRKACDFFRLAIAGGDVLVIGDQGCAGGNDVELLATPHSLSVGTISEDARSCFPVLHAGRPLLGPDGLAETLRQGRLESGTFTLDLLGR
jgi:HAD superfamily hydrolase (TIGR01484 family)